MILIKLKKIERKKALYEIIIKKACFILSMIRTIIFAFFLSLSLSSLFLLHCFCFSIDIILNNFFFAEKEKQKSSIFEIVLRNMIDYFSFLFLLIHVLLQYRRKKSIKLALTLTFFL